MNYCFYIDFLKQSEASIFLRKLALIKLEYISAKNVTFSHYVIKKNNKYHSKDYSENSQSKKFKNMEASTLQDHQKVFLLWNQYLQNKKQQMIENQKLKRETEEVLAQFDHTFLKIIRQDNYLPQKADIKINLEELVYSWGDFFIKVIEIPEKGIIFACYYELAFLSLPKNGKIRIQQYFTTILQALLNGVKQESPKILIQKFEVAINNVFQNNSQYLISKQKMEDNKKQENMKEGEIRYDWLQKSLIVKYLKSLYN